MFNKTIRSVLSLTLVFCLLLGISGNAIALAVGNPASNAIDKVDKEVNSIIADLEAKIADLEAEVAEQEQNLTDAKQKLDDGEARLPGDKALLQDKRDQLEDAKLKLADAKGRLLNAQETLAGYETQLDEYEIQLADLEDELEDLEEQLNALPVGAPGRDEKLAEVADKQAQVTAKQQEVADKQAQVMAKQQEVADAIAYIDELEDFVDQCDEKIAEYEEKIPVIEQDIADAKEILPKAEKAVKEAKEAIADAQAVVESIKTTYADLYDAVTSPEVSLSYVKQTYSDLQSQMQDLWDNVLTLQDSLHELEAAYEELEGFKIEPITIEKFEFDGFEVEEVTIDGQSFAGKKVDKFEIDGFTFNGFTAPTVDALTDISDKLDAVISKVITVNEALTTFVAAAKPYIAKALDVAEETLGITVEFLKENLSRDMHIKAYNWLCNNPDKVCALVEKFGVYGLEMLAKFGPYALDLLNNHFDLVVLAMKVTAGGVYLTYTLGAKVLGYLGDRIDFLKDYKTKVMNVARKLYAKYGDEAKHLINVYVDYLDLEERYFDATHTDLDLFCNSTYVAIGDIFAVTEDNKVSYPEVLAELLGVKYVGKNSYLVSNEMTVDHALEVLANKGEAVDAVANADLITISFSNLPALQNMIQNLIDADNYKADWSKISNDTVHELVTKALAELEENLVKYGFDANTTETVLAAAEAYAHTFALQQISYIKLINKIQAINPDAKIVIVSAYNELDTISFVGGSHKVNAGNFIQPLVDVVNMQALAEGFLNENVIYVHATDVELSDGDLAVDITLHDDLLNLLILLSSPDGLVPTNDSYAYIAEEILAALNVTKHDHEMGEWYVVTPATEEAEGLERRDCVRCDYYETRPIDKLQPGVDPEDPDHVHVPAEPVVENEVPADCVNDGSYDEVVYCSVCGEELSRETVIVPALGHVPGDVVIENVVGADCYTAGSYDEVVYCTVCGCELSRETVTGKIHHANVIVEHIPVEPSCTEDGYHYYHQYCTICGTTLYETTIPVKAKGHTPDDVVIENEVAADCVNSGSYDEVVYCTVCECELSRETVIVPALGHTEGDVVIENEVPADCVNNGSYDKVVYCTVCECELSRETVIVPALGHTAGAVEIENEVPADCVNPGSYDEVVYCSVCGEELSRVTVTVPALGHTYGNIVFENEIPANCTDPGSVDAVIYCTVCGEELSRETYVLDATGHVMGEWELVKLPTFSEDGELRRYCLYCDYYESYILPDLNAPDFDFDFRCDLLDKLRELYDLLGDKIFDLVEDATHAEYTVFHDSLYVALGDGSAASYPEKLAQLMEIPHMLENLSQSGMTMEEAIELVGKQADLIGDADLITLGFSNVAASIDMLEALSGQYTADWSGAVGEKAAAAMDKAIAELKERLIAEGLDDETVNMIIDGANAYAYAYAARCMLYPALVDAVRDVNSDALIVIVGTYNDMEDVVVDINGHEINIGEYTKYLIYAANLENLLQAICGENVIYVHAPEVETVFEENEYGKTNILGYLMSLANDEMMPSEAGSAYIAQQIRDALTVKYAIWGDVNGDRKVDCRDARLILRYAAQLITEDDLDLEWADVNGDGKVNARDARLILRLRAQLIEHFPVCRFSEE